MNPRKFISLMAGACALLGSTIVASATSGRLYPAVLAGPDAGGSILVGCERGQSLLWLDAVSGTVLRSVAMPGPVSDVCLSADGQTVYVSCSGAESRVLKLDTADGRILGQTRAGHSVSDLYLCLDQDWLMASAQFDNAVVGIYTPDMRPVDKPIPAAREPVGSTQSGSGRLLLIANQLPSGRADVADVGAEISVYSFEKHEPIPSIALPPGSTSVRGIYGSPDGKYAVVPHLLSRFHLPTTQVENGWINANALSIINTSKRVPERIGTILLDGPGSGAANPWHAAWSRDGRQMAVAHAGTHEVSLIDFSAVLEGFENLRKQPPAKDGPYLSVGPQEDLTFLADKRVRIALAENQKGPRSVLLTDDAIWTANYYSDSLTRIPLDPAGRPLRQQMVVRLPGSDIPMTEAEMGDLYFHDGDLCFQGWQSCASCHPGAARVDGLNWDLLNDGMGNPKSTRSLLLSEHSMPAMSMGVRASSKVAVRAGIRHILFTEQPEAVPLAMEAYLNDLKPVPSPLLVDGRLSPSAERGQILFADPAVGCVDCHSGPHHTDMLPYDVGTASRLDRPGDRFITPRLVEAWRTGPYLHDGSAATMLEVLTSANPEDRHGRTSHLSEQDLQDLANYLLSL